MQCFADYQVSASDLAGNIIFDQHWELSDNEDKEDECVSDVEDEPKEHVGTQVY